MKLAEAWRRFAARMMEPTSPRPLGVFRIAFGLFLAAEVIHYEFVKGHAAYLASQTFLFKFPLLGWIHPLPGVGLKLHVAVIAGAALLLAAGLAYRAAAITFALAFTWLFLLDQGEYKNHNYLICLLAWQFCFVDAQAAYSWDRRKQADGVRQVPFWQLFLLRAQIVVVYFFGGIAKLTPDWLAGEPVLHWLPRRAPGTFVGGILETELAAHIVTLGGIAFDLSIGFLLWSRRTRRFVVPLVIGFHLTNNWLFNIGVFPWLMMGAIVLFWEPRAQAEPGAQAGKPAASKTKARAKTAPASRAPKVVAAFLALQILLPLRHWLYRGDVNWTEEGHLFSWRMMLRTKQGAVRFTVRDRKTRESIVIDPAKEIAGVQLHRMNGRPGMIRTYAEELARRYRNRGWDPEVFADTTVMLNYRPPQPLIDPKVDLARVRPSLFRSATWILPLDPGVKIVPRGKQRRPDGPSDPGS